MAAQAGTRFGTIVRGEPGPLGYRRLTAGPGAEHLLRGGPAPCGRLRGITCFVHVTDLHVLDAQSPARMDFLDRLADSDSPYAPTLRRVGSYRPQEPLTYHVVEAMARAVRAVHSGPLTGRAPDFAVSTGDATDNAQGNELRSYLALLDGGVTVLPDSGRSTAFDGSAAADRYDPRYWYPDGPPPGCAADRRSDLFGFPRVPGLHDACRLPFAATGLGLPWYAGYGNHDLLLGGVIPYSPALAALGTGAGNFATVADEAAIRRQRQAGDQVEQRRLAAAGVPDQGNEFTFRDGQIDVAQCHEGAFASLEAHADIFDGDDLLHDDSPQPCCS